MGGFGHFAGQNVRIWKRYKDDGVLAQAVKVLVADPKAAALAYARISGNCSVCGRTLTVPESIDRGIGPICLFTSVHRVLVVALEPIDRRYGPCGDAQPEIVRCDPIQPTGELTEQSAVANWVENLPSGAAEQSRGTYLQFLRPAEDVVAGRLQASAGRRFSCVVVMNHHPGRLLRLIATIPPAPNGQVRRRSRRLPSR